MKNLTKTFLGAASLVAVMAGNAYAADDTAPAAATGLFGSDYPITASLAFTNDYRFRGISQDDREATPQGSLTLGGPDGFYVSVWASKTDWGLPRPSGETNNPSYEVDEYIGKHTDLWGTDLNTEAYYYSYPDYNDGHTTPKASYFEVINQLTHAFGPVTVVGTWAYSPEFSLGGGTGNYLEGTVTYAITDWLSASGDVGHQWVQGAKYYLAGTPDAGDGDYTHFDAGLTATYKSLALDVRYYGTDADALTCSYYMANGHSCAGGFVVMGTYNIASFPW